MLLGGGSEGGARRGARSGMELGCLPLAPSALPRHPRASLRGLGGGSGGGLWRRRAGTPAADDAGGLRGLGEEAREGGPQRRRAGTKAGCRCGRPLGARADDVPTRPPRAYLAVTAGLRPPLWTVPRRQKSRGRSQGRGERHPGHNHEVEFLAVVAGCFSPPPRPATAALRPTRYTMGAAPPVAARDARGRRGVTARAPKVARIGSSLPRSVRRYRPPVRAPPLPGP